MPHPTINRQDSIEIFHQLMQSDSQFRVLRLFGESKMGKSHLVTKVFPRLARDTYSARCAVLDLRNRTQSSLDILHAACSLLGGDVCFPTYTTGYREWMNRPQVEVKGLRAIFAPISIRPQGEASETSKVARDLTLQFTADLLHLNDGLVLLLFDALEQTAEDTRSWLTDTLLVHLAQHSHVRLVMAGCLVPEAHGSYASICRSDQLPPVEEDEEYIDFCHRIGAELADQSIRDLARAFSYKPGLFVDYVVPTFAGQEASRG